MFFIKRVKYSKIMLKNAEFIVEFVDYSTGGIRTNFNDLK